MPGSAVAGSWLDDGLYAIVRMPGGQRFWVEPVGLRIGADPRLHAVYDENDVIPTGNSCAADTAHMVANLDLDGGEGGIAGGPTSICTTQLACDADFPYYQDYNSSIQNVEDRINAVVALVNNLYQNQVDITHVISAIIVRTSQVYTTNNAVDLLNPSSVMVFCPTYS